MSEQKVPQIVALAGAVTVGYRKEGATWHATALEFDILGTGRTRQQAFAELRDLVNLYLRTYIESRGPVRFFNRSPKSEHVGEETETYLVAIAVTGRDHRRLPGVLRPADLRTYRKRIGGMDLIPQPVCPKLQPA